MSTITGMVSGSLSPSGNPATTTFNLDAICRKVEETGQEEDDMPSPQGNKYVLNIYYIEILPL